METTTARDVVASTRAIEKTDEKAHSLLEQVLMGGDLSRLSAAMRLQYYQEICRSLGLNPLTRPFDYITLNGRLTLYAKKDAADQLRRLHNISLVITHEGTEGEIYSVRVKATDKDGRTDEDMGAVSVAGLKGEALINARLKAVTKAKRRTTLSICGLGLLDESELETIRDARPTHVDTDTGEVLDGTPAPTPVPSKAARSGESDREVGNPRGAVRSGEDTPHQPAPPGLAVSSSPSGSPEPPGGIQPPAQTGPAPALGGKRAIVEAQGSPASAALSVAQEKDSLPTSVAPFTPTKDAPVASTVASQNDAGVRVPSGAPRDLVLQAREVLNPPLSAEEFKVALKRLHTSDARASFTAARTFGRAFDSKTLTEDLTGAERALLVSEIEGMATAAASPMGAKA